LNCTGYLLIWLASSISILTRLRCIDSSKMEAEMVLKAVQSMLFWMFYFVHKGYIICLIGWNLFVCHVKRGTWELDFRSQKYQGCILGKMYL